MHFKQWKDFIIDDFQKQRVQKNFLGLISSKPTLNLTCCFVANFITKYDFWKNFSRKKAEKRLSGKATVVDMAWLESALDME